MMRGSIDYDASKRHTRNGKGGGEFRAGDEAVCGRVAVISRRKVAVV